METIEEYRIIVDNLPVNIRITGGKGVTKIYNIDVPQLTVPTRALIDNIKRNLVREVVVSTREILDPKEVAKLKEKFGDRAKTVLKAKMPNMDERTSNLIINVLIQDMLGLGNIEYLIGDENLEEIVITSSKEPIRVYHKKHGWLETNIFLQNEEQILNYSNIIARRVGRQITMLNPLLDAHLITGDRANAVLYPISTKGHTITIRKFARDPWTITDFIKNKTCTSKILAIMWIAIQYEMNILVSGGTASGKTSLLNVLMPFMPPNHRIVSIEDSVYPEEKILYRENGIFKKEKIGSLIDSKIKKSSQILPDGTEVSLNKEIEIFSINKDGKIDLAVPSSFIRHKIKKDMYEVRLASGKRIKVTGDHSLFSLINNKMEAVKCSELKIGDFLATPRKMSHHGGQIVFDLSEYLDVFKSYQLEGSTLIEIIKANKDLLLKLRSKAQVNSYIRNKRMPVSVSLKLNVKLNEKIKRDIKILPLRSSKNGRIKIPLLIEIDSTLSCLAGLWLADGSYDKNSVIFSVIEKECNNIVKIVASKIDAIPKLHSDGLSLMIHLAAFKKFFENVLNLKGDAYTKTIPSWVFNLDQEKLAWFIRGYISGDGWPRKNDLCIGSCSLEMLEDLQTLFLRFGIIFRLSRHKYKDNTYQGFISGSKFLKLFYELGGFIQERQNKKLRLAIKESIKDVSDIIPLSSESYLTLKHILGKNLKDSISYKTWKSWQTRYKKNNIGRSYLQRLLEKVLPLETSIVNPDLYENVKSLVFNDIFWDKIKEIKREKYEGYVYDLSIPGNENFICNNVICHNTRELQLPKFLYWCPLTTRQPNPEGLGGVEMLDLLVNSLRMRPDRVILGEMRKKDQAEVLFEAMHTGHSVYATVHADSIGDTISRLVNPPIEVPKNLLLGVNLNVVMFRDRRKGIRRIYQMGEFIPAVEEGGQAVRPNILYRWKPQTDEIVEHSTSIRLYEELSRHTGMTLAEIEKDILTKSKILEWMAENNVRHVDDVGELMRRYYIDPESVVETAGAQV